MGRVARRLAAVGAALIALLVTTAPPAGAQQVPDLCGTFAGTPIADLLGCAPATPPPSEPPPPSSEPAAPPPSSPPPADLPATVVETMPPGEVPFVAPSLDALPSPGAVAVPSADQVMAPASVVPASAITDDDGDGWTWWRVLLLALAIPAIALWFAAGNARQAE